MGFMAPRTRRGSPVVTPPSRPPARFESRPKPPVRGAPAPERWHRGPGIQDSKAPRKAVPDLHPLHSLNRKDRLPQPAIQLSVPGHMAPQTHGNPPGHDLEDSPKGIPLLLGPVDGLHHGLGGFRIQRPHRGGIRGAVQVFRKGVLGSAATTSPMERT